MSSECPSGVQTASGLAGEFSSTHWWAAQKRVFSPQCTTRFPGTCLGSTHRSKLRSQKLMDFIFQEIWAKLTRVLSSRRSKIGGWVRKVSVLKASLHPYSRNFPLTDTGEDRGLSREPLSPPWRKSGQERKRKQPTGEAPRSSNFSWISLFPREIRLASHRPPTPATLFSACASTLIPDLWIELIETSQAWLCLQCCVQQQMFPRVIQ